MRCRTPVVLGLVVALPALGGCAAAANVFRPDECKVYGGTRVDATLVSEGFAPDGEMAKDKKLERPVLVWEGCRGLVDLPFSAVVDTLTLPVTVSAALRGAGDESEADEETPSQGEDSARVRSSEE